MPSHSFLRRSSSQRTPSRKTSNKKATQKIEWLSSDFRFCGSWGIRTPDPLLVRQTLWTSWAKLPLKMARDCKGNHYFLSSKFFKKFTRRKFPHHSLKLPFATFAHRVRFPFGIQRDANIRIFSETTHNKPIFLTKNIAWIAKNRRFTEVFRGEAALDRSAKTPLFTKGKIHSATWLCTLGISQRTELPKSLPKWEFRGTSVLQTRPGPRISILRIRCCDRRIKGYRKLRQNKTNKFVYSALIFTTFVKRHEKNHR